MAVTVTMLQTRRGEDGNLWTAGSAQNATDAFAQFLISSNLATGTLPAVPQSGLSADEEVRVKALVSGDGKTRTAPRRARTVHPAPPTLVYSLTAPTGRRVTLPWKDAARPVGCVATFNDSNATLTVTAAGICGVHLMFTGTSFVFAWRTQTGAAERVMVYLDGQPCMATPATPSVTTTTGGYCYLTVTFGAAVKDASVEILVTSVAALVGLFTDSAANTVAAVPRRKIMIVGDSFMAGSAAISSNSDLPPSVIQLSYDVDVSNNSLGGTGHATDNGGFKRFSDDSRVLLAADFKPDTILIVGSVNDDDKTGIQAAAALSIAKYRAAAPNATIRVFGPTPSTATGTTSTARRSNNQAVRAAAESAGVEFVDLIGNSGPGTIRAFAAFTFFEPGEIVSHLGSYWVHDRPTSAQYPGTYAPGLDTLNSVMWKLLSSGYYGTGAVGATVGDGTRDTWVHSDAAGHPTVPACANYAAILATDLT